MSGSLMSSVKIPEPFSNGTSFVGLTLFPTIFFSAGSTWGLEIVIDVSVMDNGGPNLQEVASPSLPINPLSARRLLKSNLYFERGKATKKRNAPANAYIPKCQPNQFNGSCLSR